MTFSDWSDYFFIIYVYLFIICIYYHFKMIVLAPNEKTKGHAILLDFRPYIQWIFDNILKMMRLYVYQLHRTKNWWKFDFYCPLSWNCPNTYLGSLSKLYLVDLFLTFLDLKWPLIMHVVQNSLTALLLCYIKVCMCKIASLSNLDQP